MVKKKSKEEALELYLNGKKFFESGNFDEAYEKLHDSYFFFKRTSEQSIIADIHRLLGEIQFSKGNYIESRNHYKRSFRAFQDFGNKIGMADCYDQIALSFMFQNELNHAEDYQLKALELRRNTADKKGLARALKNLAIIAFKKEADNKALEYMDDALELALRTKDPQLMINIATDKGKIENKMHFYEDAMRSFILARRLSKEYTIKLENDFDTDFADILLNLGLAKIDEKHFNDALKYLKQALVLFKTNNNSIAATVEETIEKIEQIKNKN